MNKVSGVYKIINKITGDFYIGSSNDIKIRWRDHKKPSNWKRQPNSKLYRDMAKYGRNNFQLEIIEETNNLKEREQYYMDQLSPNYNNYRAKGLDIERAKESSRRVNKEWRETHREEDRSRKKAWAIAHQEEYSMKRKADYSRLCFYAGETIKLGTLTARFNMQRIAHAYIEAKKYLIQD